jgi:hypothetical protein
MNSTKPRLATDRAVRSRPRVRARKVRVLASKALRVPAVR